MLPSDIYQPMPGSTHLCERAILGQSIHCSWNVTKSPIARHLRLCAGRKKMSVEEPGHVGIERTAPLSGLMVALRLGLYLRRGDYE